MRRSSALTLERGRWRQRTAVGIEVATEGLIRGLARAVEFVVVCIAWLLLPVWPLLAALIAGDADYVRGYWTTVGNVKKHIRSLWRGHSVSRMVAHWLTPPVLRRPESIVGSCTHCGRCCIDGDCVFVAFDAHGQSSCRIYGGRVWKHLTCARYPIDRRDIVLYRCPGFTADRDHNA